MPIIALTFDDGPNTVITPQVLDILEKEGILASFFLIAQNITPESAAVARRAYDMGCDIENHTLTHPYMDKLAVEEIRKEVQACTDKIIEITGEAPKFFRPPFIAVSQAMYDNIDMTFICGMGCEDWVPEVTAEQRAERVLANAEDGQIVLLHDMQWNQNTVEALKTIIPELKKRGYDFVTVSQLFEQKHVTPRRGWLYTNVLQETSENRL
ncbi:MAG: polysaccharide deacetylase family protein [Clostridiales bacterium]|nr:polysaccharide deacetylase family protein [Clostridiales bacterium]